MQPASCPPNKHLNEDSLHCRFSEWVRLLQGARQTRMRKTTGSVWRGCLCLRAVFTNMCILVGMMCVCVLVSACLCAHVTACVGGINKGTIHIRGGIEGEQRTLWVNTYVCKIQWLYLPKYRVFWGDKIGRKKYVMTVIFHIKVCSSNAPENLWLRHSNNRKSASRLLLITWVSDEIP